MKQKQLTQQNGNYPRKTVKIDDVFYDPPPYLNGALSSMQQKRT